VPESKPRPAAEEKKKAKRQADVAAKRDDRARRVALPGERAWVPPLFILVGLLGVAWLVVFYIAGWQIPYMRDLGQWNILIGMGMLAAAFGISTLWK